MNTLQTLSSQPRTDAPEVMDSAWKRVSLIQRTCPHYRLEFLDALIAFLAERRVKLDMYYSSGEAQSPFHRQPAWAFWYRTIEFNGVIYQPLLRKVMGSDLIIVEAANKVVLLNFLLLVVRALGGGKIAFWGHGWSHQTEHPNSLAERIKLWMSRKAHWYFAYTDAVKRGLVKRGFNADRITDVQNAAPHPDHTDVDTDSLSDVATELAVDPDATVALYCGRIHPKKRIPFLVEAAIEIKKTLPSFVLLIAGGGRTDPLAQKAAEQHDFIRFCGPVFGERKAQLFALSKVLMLPGMVGLGVVDAFHFGVPPVATEFPYHSPEIMYLEHEKNGLISADTVPAFAQEVIRVLTDDALRERLRAGCAVSSATITTDEMARRFAAGILAALDMS